MLRHEHFFYKVLTSVYLVIWSTNDCVHSLQIFVPLKWSFIILIVVKMTKNCTSIVINQFEGLENHDNVVNGKISPTVHIWHNSFWSTCYIWELLLQWLTSMLCFKNNVSKYAVNAWKCNSLETFLWWKISDFSDDWIKDIWFQSFTVYIVYYYWVFNKSVHV